MIAEAPTDTRPLLAVVVPAEEEVQTELTLQRVAGTLQLLLAARRQERNAEVARRK